jgi:hypothetical protein
MTEHRIRRSWLRLGAWWCSCGRRPGHGLVDVPVAGSRIPDGDVVPVPGYRRFADLLTEPRNRGRWRDGQRDAVTIAQIKQQIQVLVEEIAVLRAVGADDPRWATADRVVAVKVGLIRHLRGLLPSIPGGDADVRRQSREGVGAAAVPLLSGGVGAS